MIRLLLADDQPLFRQGLADLLAMEADLEVLGQASHGKEAIALAQSLQPDIILMDVRMPICDGVEATREIHQQFPWIRILVLTTFDEDEYIWHSLQAGALGYLLKSSTAAQIAIAIRSLYEGQSQLGPTIATKLFARLNPLPASTELQNYDFSARELEILELIGVGKNNREIALELHLTEGTIKNYVSKILSQLGVRDRTQAALWVQQHLSLKSEE
jgi:DNA-binding NarL/FixJ family response regulator